MPSVDFPRYFRVAIYCLLPLATAYGCATGRTAEPPEKYGTFAMGGDDGLSTDHRRLEVDRIRSAEPDGQPGAEDLKLNLQVGIPEESTYPWSLSRDRIELRVTDYGIGLASHTPRYRVYRATRLLDEDGKELTELRLEPDQKVDIAVEFEGVRTERTLAGTDAQASVPSELDLVLKSGRISEDSEEGDPIVLPLARPAGDEPTWIRRDNDIRFQAAIGARLGQSDTREANASLYLNVGPVFYWSGWNLQVQGVFTAGYGISPVDEEATEPGDPLVGDVILGFGAAILGGHEFLLSDSLTFRLGLGWQFQGIDRDQISGVALTHALIAELDLGFRERPTKPNYRFNPLSNFGIFARIERVLGNFGDPEEPLSTGLILGVSLRPGLDW